MFNFENNFTLSRFPDRVNKNNRKYLKISGKLYVDKPLYKALWNQGVQLHKKIVWRQFLTE